MVGLARLIGYPTQPTYQDLSFVLDFPKNNNANNIPKSVSIKQIEIITRGLSEVSCLQVRYSKKKITSGDWDKEGWITVVECRTPSREIISILKRLHINPIV